MQLRRSSITICAPDRLIGTILLLCESAGLTNIKYEYANYHTFKEGLDFNDSDWFILDTQTEFFELTEFIDFDLGKIKEKRVLLFLQEKDLNPGTIKLLISKGINGIYLLKDNPEEVVDSLRYLKEESFFLSRNLLHFIRQLHVGSGHLAELTMRELSVLREIKNGSRYAEVGEALNISPETVKAHLKRIYKKLDVKNKSQALSKAITHNLI